jgi:glycosyltransferase involved in cell wall biosynthesis
MPAGVDRKVCLALDIRFVHRPSGGGVYTRHIALGMVGLGQASRYVVVYNPASEPQQALLAQLTGATGVSVEPYPVRSGCLTLGQHVEFLTRRFGADVYFYPHFDAPWIPVGPKLVLTVHDLYPLVLPGYCSRGRRAFFAGLTRRNCRRAARVLTVSEHTAGDLTERLGIPREKITVVHNGVDESFRPLDSGVLAQVRQKYNLPERFILCTGNHKPHKNLARLLQAYASLHLQGLALVVTGRDRYTAGLELMVAKLCPGGQVHWLGQVPAGDLPGVYNLATLYVLPSLYEGFGLGALEALACGTAVVAAKAAAIPEVVGEHARLFDPRDCAEMACTIETA